MRFRPDSNDSTFHEWLASAPSEDDLREAYLTLEGRRADLWTPGHIDSFRRDRYDLDARYIRQLVQIKKALASHWIVTGQVDDAVALS